MQPDSVFFFFFSGVDAGGIYAYVLERSKRCRVTAITRSLYHSIQTHGLTINSAKYGNTKNWKPYRLVRTAEEAADRDYRFIVCCVKCLPDVEVCIYSQRLTNKLIPTCFYPVFFFFFFFL
jgi:hypothetical protein